MKHIKLALILTLLLLSLFTLGCAQLEKEVKPSETSQNNNTQITQQSTYISDSTLYGYGIDQDGQLSTGFSKSYAFVIIQNDTFIATIRNNASATKSKQEFGINIFTSYEVTTVIIPPGKSNLKKNFESANFTIIECERIDESCFLINYS